MIDPTETLEELYSLLLITGHVLSDEGEGEIPVVISYFFLLIIKLHFIICTVCSFFSL